MSTNFSLTARAALLSAALVLPALTACAQDGQIANTATPHPELTGQANLPYDTRVQANLTNPHPELNGYSTVFAKTAPSK